MGNHRHASTNMDGMTVTSRQIQPVTKYPKSSTYRHTLRDKHTDTHRGTVTSQHNIEQLLVQIRKQQQRTTIHKNHNKIPVTTRNNSNN